uniref:Osteocalcin 2-like n=1 Tax=Geotrypetes seraphini TaxID=260995 RepID=A0A6P8RBN1_GEOSA|nr:osteocalcin 2-like [Geotrypetes seraphini]
MKASPTAAPWLGQSTEVQTVEETAEGLLSPPPAIPAAPTRDCSDSNRSHAACCPEIQAASNSSQYDISALGPAPLKAQTQQKASLDTDSAFASMEQNSAHLKGQGNVLHRSQHTRTCKEGRQRRHRTSSSSSPSSSSSSSSAASPRRQRCRRSKDHGTRSRGRPHQPADHPRASATDPSIQPRQLTTPTDHGQLSDLFNRFIAQQLSGQRAQSKSPAPNAEQTLQPPATWRQGAETAASHSPATDGYASERNGHYQQHGQPTHINNPRHPRHRGRVCSTLPCTMMPSRGK